MAITTLDAALAGMMPPRHWAKVATPTMVVGRPQSLWGLAGSPGAGAFDTTLNGVALSSSSSMVNGQIPHVDPASLNAYLARFSAGVSQAGVLMLCDRLWHNGGYTITSTGAQNTTFPGLPSRDASGSSNGDGVLLGLEISAAAGAAAPTITVGYTNSANTASRSATNLDATANSPTAGTFYRIGLQAGDIGVRSVQSLTLSASWVSGTINLVAYRVLAALEFQAAGGNAIDALTAGFPRLYNGVVPFMIFVPTATTALTTSGTYLETQG